ncbi:MAG: LLM class flavin-dependent oxidoreductase [Chloroflexia bacterium]|nr:LLM class flavin-dependent oxidoreductase [Chloroflexia bacterium]
MKYGIVIPKGDPRTVAGLAREAEDHGWDAVFTWDGMHTSFVTEVYDPWVTMAAIAMATERVRIGAMLTPLSRRRPWKVARETATLDILSGGRLVLPVGLGAVDSFGDVGEVTDRRGRAELLDESLAILDGLWSGEPFAFAGKHYRLGEMTFLPRPVQRPRVPIWVPGRLGSERSMARVARCDGMILEEVTPGVIREALAYVAEHRRTTTPFDIIAQGTVPGDDPGAATETIGPLAEAGATWWVESPWDEPNGPDEVRARIWQGPPAVSGLTAPAGDVGHGGMRR